MARFDISSFTKRVPGKGKALLLILAAFLLGMLLSGGGDSTQTAPAAAAGRGAVKWYTCSMHPSVKLQDPNARCPICGMELIPVTEEADDSGSPRRLSMSEGAKLLAEVQTAPVVRRMVVKEVNLVGKVGYDETSQRTITAWVPGRLDRLHVDYTGVAVRRGAPLVYMYSPELLVAQEGLLEADRAHQRMKASSASAGNLRMLAATVRALEDRLRLWGLTGAQVSEIRKRGTASDHMTILSPIAGIVTAKRAVEGDYVRVGTKIYEIADLSTVWVYLDAYESDVAWTLYAQKVEFEAEAYPGELFLGRVSFIDPFLDEMTRTVKVRVTVQNLDGRLKPGMFVRARIHAMLAEGDRIVEPSLAGKWVSPAHPEIVTDEPGNCPKCGTPLVSGESLGYVGEDARAPLVIPATAPLVTGKRAVVYVEVPDADRPTYEGRQVVLGPRTREHYIVRKGLKEGERVVVKGAFKIDSALQILARPSMMSPPDESDGRPSTEVAHSFVAALSPVYEGSVRVQRALAADDLNEARTALEELGQATETVSMRRITGEARQHWTRLRERIAKHARGAAAAGDLAAARVAFDEVSKAVLDAARVFGQATGVELFEVHCPMAFDNRGASWLADTKEVSNPWFGAKMPRCGDVRASFPTLGEGPRVSSAFRAALTPFWDAMLEAHGALAGDDLAAARQAAANLLSALDTSTAQPGEAWLSGVWAGLLGRAKSGANALSGAVDIQQARASFERLSGVAIAILQRFGHSRAVPLREAFCPMAFDNRGAAWIQAGEKIRNPYFGASMPACGEIRRTLEPVIVRAVPAAFRAQLSAAVAQYLALSEALSKDDFGAALELAPAVDAALAAIKASALDSAAREDWRKLAGGTRSAVETMAKGRDLEALRRPFALLSDNLVQALARFGHAGPDDLSVARCPMAFNNRGADWIQRGDEIRNPYFGAIMYRCGDVTRRLSREGGK